MLDRSKENKGITLLVLILTIVALLILVGVSINEGIDVISDTRENKQLEELAIIQHAILEKYASYKLTGNTNIIAGIRTNYSNVDTIIGDINKKSNQQIKLKQENYDSLDILLDISEYYYELTPTQLNEIKELNITKATDTYIVNYKTGEVINATQMVTNKGTPLYIYATE